MIRLILPMVLAISTAAPLVAQSKQDRFCDELGYASQQMADLRIDGSDEGEVQEIVAGQYEADQVTHLQMIPYLSSFVFGLTDKQLRGDVEGEFAKQCKAFKG